jgi:hypothetical protein
MKKNYSNENVFFVLSKKMNEVFNNLFFINNKKDFERLKNFIAS